MEGRKITFKVEGFDEKEKIGEAVHERFIINAEKFNQRWRPKRTESRRSLNFSYDLVTLGHFEAGWGWDAQVRQYVRKKYRQDLAGLAELDPRPLARLAAGRVLAGPPLRHVSWVLRLKPFRPLELYWLFDHGPGIRRRFTGLLCPEESGGAHRGRLCLCLGFRGPAGPLRPGQLPLGKAGPGPEWLPFADFAASGRSLQDVSLGAREELLTLLTPEVVEVAMRRLDCGDCRLRGGWQVVWPILGDLSFRLRMAGGASEMAFDSQGARKYGPEFLTSFSWLYINALLRECRQVDPSLPQLSRYF